MNGDKVTKLKRFETSTQRKRRLQKAKQKRDDKKTQLSDTDRNSIKIQHKLYMRQYSANEMAEKRASRLNAIREYVSKVRSTESENERKVRLQYLREHNAKSRALQKARVSPFGEEIYTFCDKVCEICIKRYYQEKNCIFTSPLTRICRTCNVSYSPEIFKLKSCPKDYGGMMLLDLLKEVTNIDIEMEYSEKLPQFLCSNCVCKLQNAYDFIIQARDTSREMMNFLNGINTTEFLPEVSMEVCTEPVIDIKIEEDSYEDSTTQNDEYNYNESLSPLVLNEALENSHDEIVGSEELDVTSSYKMNQSTISKNETTQSRTECLEEMPIKVYTERTNELIIKDEPCEIESGNEGNDDESLDALVMNGIVKNRDDHNDNLGFKYELHKYFKQINRNILYFHQTPINRQ